MKADSKKSKPPGKLPLFISLGFDFSLDRFSGKEAYGECPFCGKDKHFYINCESGLWSCKRCGEEGNVQQFVEKWYDLFDTETQEGFSKEWKLLSKNRGIPIELLKRAGLIYTGDTWIIPTKNIYGKVTNLYRYNIGGEAKGLAGLEAGLFGLENLGKPDKLSEPVFICEGPWDKIAWEWVLSEYEKPGVVVGVPGANVFKPRWVPHLSKREITLFYDNDTEGYLGTKRAYENVKHIAKSVQYIKWPETFPQKSDLRDLVNKTDKEKYSKVMKLVRLYIDETEEQGKKSTVASPETHISDRSRPKWKQVVEVFKKYLYMPYDMVMCLKIIDAVILTTQIEGAPLWLHIVSPAGSGKSELLLSTEYCYNTFFQSKIGPHSLISGFKVADADPSILPKLNNKTFVLKDFTEILALPVSQKEEIYGVLRGAYDGTVDQTFGNMVSRNYKTHFNMVTGVTPDIFSDNNSSVGERFLIYHFIKGVGFDSYNEIGAAIDAISESKGNKMKEELSEIQNKFLDVKINKEDLPVVTKELKDHIICLAQIVSMLRAGVRKDKITDVLDYRPQHEVGTRLAQELTKLAMGLALINYPSKIGAEEYTTVVRVALDTCVGFNLDAIKVIALFPGETLQFISEKCNVPLNTLRNQVDNLIILGVIKKVLDLGIYTNGYKPTPATGITSQPPPPGIVSPKSVPTYIQNRIGGATGNRPTARYYATETFLRLWKGAGMPYKDEEEEEEVIEVEA